MKVAIVGAGFTGLSAALRLQKKGNTVVIFEKEKILGGLASGYKKKGWESSIERHYHHWFTNDRFAIDLITNLGLEKDLLVPSPLTSIYYAGNSYPFNSPLHVLTFPHLNLLERLRCGIIVLYLKLLPASIAIKLEKYTAYFWLKKYFGNKTFKVLWKPLLDGKFGKYANTVNMAWFWARIHKRTPRLAYLLGGYQRLLEKMSAKIVSRGGKVKLGVPFDKKFVKDFNKVIFTGPSFIFTQVFPDLPSAYQKQLLSIPHLHALNMLLITDEKILEKSYWLNINDRRLPFLAIVAHTNFVDSKYYGNKHLTWVGNYLPPGHPFLKKSKEELLKLFTPHLKKINKGFDFNKIKPENAELFQGFFAQPVVEKNYSIIKPQFDTPIKNIYLANMDMVYPWDRGTNYAIELGYSIAAHIENRS